MRTYWSPLVAGLLPYVAGEQASIPGLVKLNTNECAYGPSPRVLQAISEETTEDLRLYPDPDSRRLKRAVAQRFALADDQVFVGNGSDEVLAHVFQALLSHERPTLFPDVTYSFRSRTLLRSISTTTRCQAAVSSSLIPTHLLDLRWAWIKSSAS